MSGILTLKKVSDLVTKFKIIHGNDRLKIIQKLDETIGSDIRKPSGKLKTTVNRALDEKGITPVSGEVSGAIGGSKPKSLETKSKLRKAQKKILKEKKDLTNIPPSERDAVTKRRLAMTEYDKARKTQKSYDDRRKSIAIRLDRDPNKIAMDPEVAKHSDLLRAEEFAGINTPFDELGTIYPLDYTMVMKRKDALQKAITSGDTDSIVSLLRSYGAADNQIMASIGHHIPVELAINIKNKIAPHMTDVEFITMINKSKNIGAELNLLNTQKKPIERMLYRPDVGWEKRHLKDLDAIMKDAQVKSKFFTPEGEMTSIGMQGFEIDPQKLKWWINKTMDENMFKGGDKLRLLPNKKILKSMYDLNYSTGGLVKLLSKLKLTKKQKDLILKTAYSPKKKPGTGPRLTRERRVKQKIRDLYGKEKRWKYVKSKVPGPKSSLQRKAEKEFFKHTEVWPDRKKKAAGGILSHYVR